MWLTASEDYSLSERRGGATACRLMYRGEIAQQDTRLLTSAFCAGLLEGAMDEEVNIVNAEVLLKERGVDVSCETRSDSGTFRSSITVELMRDGGTCRAAGTLFGSNMPRLIQLDQYRLEAYLDGTSFVFTHDDVPGIIGAVGTIFGRHQVNIAQMAVGRSGASPGWRAIGVLNLDAVPPQEGIDEVLQHEHVHSADVIRLPAWGQLPSWLQS